MWVCMCIQVCAVTFHIQYSVCWSHAYHLALSQCAWWSTTVGLVAPLWQGSPPETHQDKGTVNILKGTRLSLCKWSGTSWISDLLHSGIWRSTGIFASNKNGHEEQLGPGQASEIGMGACLALMYPNYCWVSCLIFFLEANIPVHLNLVSKSDRQPTSKSYLYNHSLNYRKFLFFLTCSILRLD